MKTIGFMDIHPNNPLCGQQPVYPGADVRKDDASAIYVFRKTGDQYTHERTLAFHDQVATAGIDAFYVSIPATMVDFRILNFPFSDREKIRKATPLELDTLILANPDEIIFDMVMLADSGDTVNVLLAYLKNDALEKLLAVLMRWKIDPQIVTSLDLRMLIDAQRKTGSDVLSESIAGWLTTPMDWNSSRRLSAARTEISTPVINLRSGPFAYRKDVEKTKRAFRITFLLSVLLVVIIHAGLLTQTIMIKQKTLSVAREMRTAYGKLFPADRKVVDELYQLKSHFKETKERSDALTGTDILRLLQSLSQRMVPNVVYTDIHLEKGIIRMKAEARSMDDLTRVHLKLSEFLSDVSISDVKPMDRGKILFTVVAKEQRS